MNFKERALRNRTITLTDEEKARYSKRLLKLLGKAEVASLKDQIINQDLFEILSFFPRKFVDLLFIDPPYNLSKTFNAFTFKEMTISEYVSWIDSWLLKLVPILKPTASIYICGDWRSSGAIQEVAEKYFTIRNRITWEREKGRGARTNWKNASEDIWFCTMSDQYVFNVEDVKLKKKVLAPYTNEEGTPKDWQETDDGRYRLTNPSNLWTDLTVPFWSMPENTDHPTQKPEKLLAKIILASSRTDDFVCDPFLGSGTTCVVSKKLGRRFLGIELDRDYSCVALKRLELAELDDSIQGYAGSVFWERNSFQEQPKQKRTASSKPMPSLF